MSAPSITVVENPDALAERAADHFIELVGAAIAARGWAAVALAGGSTPRAMNALLAAPPRRDQLDWTKVRFFFGDERCVPPDHPDSNYRMTRETLFVPLGIADTQIARIRGEDEPHAAAAAYDAILESVLGAPPIFDVVYLGMGPDGHTASLFPGTIGVDRSKPLRCREFRAQVRQLSRSRSRRACSTPRGMSRSPRRRRKADSLAAVLNGPHEPDRYPAQLIAPVDGDVDWLVDAAAAARL